jgi:3-oxoacyl-[acyl-carrier protein] reductase
MRLASPMTTDRPLAGRTALVTGSGRNIGRAVALAFAAAGANVVINGHRDRSAVDRVVEEAEALGAGALGVMADVADPGEVEAMAVQASQRFGSVDIAVSNVSVRYRQPFLSISIEDWNRVLATNLSGAFHVARAVLPSMQSRGWGRIIHMSGHDGFLGAINRAHNVVCKAGVHALSKALAQEFGPNGITVNTVAPGVIDTERDEVHYPNYRVRYHEIAAELPVRRIGTVGDVAAACLYLASEASGFVTGQVIHVNGGESFA